MSLDEFPFFGTKTKCVTHFLLFFINEGGTLYSFSVSFGPGEGKIGGRELYMSVINGKHINTGTSKGCEIKGPIVTEIPQKP